MFSVLCDRIYCPSHSELGKYLWKYSSMFSAKVDSIKCFINSKWRVHQWSREASFLQKSQGQQNVEGLRLFEFIFKPKFLKLF